MMWAGKQEARRGREAESKEQIAESRKSRGDGNKMKALLGSR